MSSARTHARNLIAQWGSHGASMAVLFFLSPFVVHTLGAVDYGIWSLLNVLMGYMGILDLGIRASTGRHVILYLGKEDHDAVSETLRTGLGFFAAVGGLILLAGVGLGYVFPDAFASVPDRYHGLVQALVPLMAVSVVLAAFSTVFSSVLTAHDRFDLARGVDVGVLVVRTAGTVAALLLGYGLLGLVAVTISSHALALVANYVIAHRVYPRLQAWPLTLNRRRLRELFGYGVAAFVTAVSVKVIGQTDLIIVGAALGVSAVTVYSVGAMLVYYTSSFIAHIASVFFPPVQRAAARGEMGDVRWMLFRQVRLAMLMGLPVYIGFVFFGQPFIRLWMLGPAFGEESVRLAAIVMAVLAGSKLLALFALGSRQVLNAIGRYRFNAVLVVVEATANLGLSLIFVLVFRWGLTGVALGTITARAAVGVFVRPWYLSHRIGLSFARYLYRIGGAMLLAGGMFSGWCWLVRRFLPTTTWGGFVAAVGVSLAGYIPIAWWALLPKADRKRMLAKIAGRSPHCPSPRAQGDPP
jgi:O-antigen/teichoic acid export membrane protein